MLDELDIGSHFIQIIYFFEYDVQSLYNVTLEYIVVLLIVLYTLWTIRIEMLLMYNLICLLLIEIKVLHEGNAMIQCNIKKFQNVDDNKMHSYKNIRITWITK